MIVLGLNAFGHDAAAVLLLDGEAVFASSQERYDRARHSSAFPAHAIDAALSRAGIARRDIDAIAFPWTRDMGRGRKLAHVVRGLPRSRAYFRDPPDTRLPSRRGYLKDMRGLEKRLRAAGFSAPLHRIPHHKAHAASAALALPAGSGAIITADGMGEWTTAATWRADGHRLTRLRRAVYPHSPGKFYAAVTQWLGFVPESDEGKTMGLAAYGQATSRRDAITFLISSMIGAQSGSLCEVATPYFGFPWGEAQLYGPRFVDALGPARQPDMPLRDDDALVAFGAQTAITAWGGDVCEHLRESLSARDIGLAGGLFLNCAMNGALHESEAEHGVGVHPFPVAGDAGAAWGAAADVHRRLVGKPAAPLRSLYLGHEITQEEASHVAGREGMTDATPDAVAEQIAAGRIVAVARGRAEFGPRALGNRSILASPTTATSRDRVNALKGREDWRPLAPIVRAEDTRWFERQAASRYMILTFRATERAKREIPGVVHVDGTARVQTVAEGENDFLRAVLDGLEARGHPPVVINTSLNRRGEPIVNTAEQAFTSTKAMALDALVVGDYLWNRTPFKKSN